MQLDCSESPPFTDGFLDQMSLGKASLKENMISFLAPCWHTESSWPMPFNLCNNVCQLFLNKIVEKRYLTEQMNEHTDKQVKEYINKNAMF